MSVDFAQVLKEVQERKPHIANHTALIKREFVSMDSNGESLPETNTTHSLRIMTWNILAQGLCKCSDSFVLCPREALEWSVRQNLILEELLTYKPDILCLQEVDNFNHLQQHLQPAGYKGVFFPKPDSPCLYTKDSNGPDGCAVFWNHQRLLSKEINNLNLRKSPDGKVTNQVAIVCKFQFQSENEDGRGSEFFITTTHLKSKKGYHALRYDQGHYLERWLLDHCHGSPLIVCGDFNAEPHEKVVNVFKESSLGLCSSYTLLSEDGTEPPYTTWKVRGNILGKQEEFCHTIDYMFFTPQYLTCLKLLKPPTGEEIGEGRLPSFSYPSDHLSLVVDFYLSKVQEATD